MAFVAPRTWVTGEVVTAAYMNAEIRDQFNKGVVRPLGEVTLSGAAASIDFSSIAADWSHLLIVAYAQGDTAALNTNINIRFNGDVGSNYDSQIIRGSGATASAVESLATTVIGIGTIPANTATANVFGTAFVLIPYYANSANQKAAVGVAGGKWGTATGTMSTFAFGGFWRSNAAINQVTLLASVGNLVSGSRATLYGLASI